MSTGTKQSRRCREVAFSGGSTVSKTLTDYLLFPPLSLYIYATLISRVFCFARVLDHPVRSTTDLHLFTTTNGLQV